MKEDNHISAQSREQNPTDPGKIRFIPRQEIDTAKWDACISQAPNSMLYGLSYYLDVLTAESWDALVLNDYAAIMPLTRRKKWGISYCYQPPFSQQLGIFAAPPHVAATLVPPFLKALQSRFRFAEIFLNHGNAHPSLTPYVNYILSLNAPYHSIASGYKPGLVKSLKLASRYTFQYTTAPDLHQVLIGFKDRYQDRTPHVNDEMYTRLRKLCEFLRSRDQLLLRAISSPQQEILATALLPRDANRIYLLQSTAWPAGRMTGANHLLLDCLIREFAGQPLTLDFEGSELPGIAHFYRSFGATNQPYYFFRHNKLPWPLRALK